ncbi:ATP-dependent DNA helicase [Idiomarina xiamenensis]|uniref:DNA 5'-3' helicase n=1 Tax=Idiomarina xiamenensis 10-D-4 TaxID=740709 RepID=K2K8B1_9GAMM|nr:ATP-dependent DNA helicase [Idiomarina xiamenensis]EKE82827.1 ATP-dependent DNA helicase [Idiomarina xiamenensis 10-D-4]
MSRLAERVAAVFAEAGALQQSIDGFKPRLAQQQMATAVAAALQQHGQLVVEAETGTGKTFAYLAPVLLHPKKAIISTGTKNLQEQLFYRDLPRLRDSLAPNKQVALLKGRANYLCIQRLQQATAESGQWSKAVQQQLLTIKQWAQRTRSGDVGELNLLAEDASIMPQVTSTQDNCLGRECPFYEDCYLVKARRQAMEADLVVVNHHLFFADLALKDVGFGELIPAADAVIFDEAHQLPDIASDYFGEALSTRQLSDMAEDLRLLYMTELKDLAQLSRISEKLISSVKDWRLAFPHDAMRGNWREWVKQPSITAAGQRLQENLELLMTVMKTALGRNETLDNLYERCVSFMHKWQQLQDTERNGYSFWFETTARHVILHQTPLSVAERFGRYLQESEMSWVFTSATLAIADDFSHYVDRLGLKPAQTLQLASPFNFAEQAMFCLPRQLPQPHEREMESALLEVILTATRDNDGGTFVLFTSHRMLQRMATALSEHSTRPLFVQGTSGKRDLLAQFSAAGNGILLGTSSFWEGVDVRGDALRCVIIDKLPFAAPDDPLLQARIEDAKRRGIDAFSMIQLPQAVIALKQGAGRLIRDADDSGVLIVCDNRIVTRQYGQIFLRSLPAMQRTRSLATACQFLTQSRQTT